MDAELSLLRRVAEEAAAVGAAWWLRPCWATHELSDELLGGMRPGGDPKLPPPRPRTRPIAIRFDESTILRVKALAARRSQGYQTLLKEFPASWCFS